MGKRVLPQEAGVGRAADDEAEVGEFEMESEDKPDVKDVVESDDGAGCGWGIGGSVLWISAQRSALVFRACSSCAC